jgi:pimeloyl-ACP methyl ester carboxylesterase
MMLVEKSFDTGDLVLNYAEGLDNGPPLLLLHGFTSRWQFYIPLIPHLGSRYHVYAADLRGHGKSQRTPGKYDYDHDFRDLQSFLDNVIEEQAIVMGHSRGGVQAAMLASRNPEKVKAAIILDAPLYMTAASKRNSGWWDVNHAVTQMEGSLMDKVDAFRRLEVDMGGSSVRVSDVYDEQGLLDRVTCLSMVDPGVLETKIESLLDDEAAREYQGWYNPTEVLPMIKCPVLIVQSGDGVALPDDDLNEALRLIDDVTSLRLAGHGLGIERWDVGDILRAITPFLDSLG